MPGKAHATPPKLHEHRPVINKTLAAIAAPDVTLPLQPDGRAEISALTDGHRCGHAAACQAQITRPCGNDGGCVVPRGAEESNLQ